LPCRLLGGYKPQGLWIGFGVGLSVATIALTVRLRKKAL
jgi:hypothetical protein